MRLCVVTGEASGDLHASEVVRELRALDPSLETFGFGGDLLAAEGTEILHHVSELGIVGLFNVLRHLRMFRRVFRELLDEIAKRRPDAVLLVDYPDFNLRVAKQCRRLGIPVYYYISPQVWAWRKGRLAHIEKFVDEMLVIFPFEETFYREHGVAATYVGHPLIEQLEHLEPGESAPVSDRPLRLALMPGSRRMEVATLLPAMLDAVKAMRKERPVTAAILRAPTIAEAQIQRLVADSGVEVEVVAENQRERLAASDLCVSSSGTATLESAIVGVPVIVVYRLTRLTYAVARRLVKLPHFSLVNIVAGEEVVPELIQDEVNGERIAAEARKLLQPERYRHVRRALREVRARLGEPGASRRAAARIFALMSARRAATRL